MFRGCVSYLSILLSIILTCICSADRHVFAGLVDFENYSVALGPNGYQYYVDFNSPISLTTGELTVTGSSFSISSKASFTDINNYFTNGDDTISATGTGSNGSEVWMNVFSFSPDSNILSVANNQIIQSIDYTNSLINIETYNNGLGGFSNPLNQIGDSFEVRFVSLDSSNAITGSTSWISLAQGPANFLNSWQTIDLTSLNANRIGIEFQGTDSGAFGLNTPTYLSLDNVVVAVPEPGTIATLAITSIGLGAWRVVRKRNR
jgi:hypothetical protein